MAPRYSQKNDFQYGAVRGLKMALSYYFGQWLIQQLVLPYKP